MANGMQWEAYASESDRNKQEWGSKGEGKEGARGGARRLSPKEEREEPERNRSQLRAQPRSVGAIGDATPPEPRGGVQPKRL